MKFEQIWQGINCTEPTAPFPATVPGNIQYDFGQARHFGDVSYADNYKQYLPYEDHHWEYRTHLKYQKNSGERVFFVSGGIDYRYDILLNGELLEAREGMFRPVELDLTDRLTGGDDLLTVHIYPHPKSKTGRAGTRDEADESCKPPVCYGWDWNPRLLISGMWREAYIETRDAFYIGNTEVLTSLSEELTVGTVRVSYDCKEPCEILLYDPAGKEVYRGEDTEFSVEAPALWWCHGQGEPALYRWVIRNAREERTGTVGFRRIRLLRNPKANDPFGFPKPRYPVPATVELNGRPVLMKGSNWVNPELFWGQITTERYDELLGLAVDANMNMLRIWGGASVCKPAFYELCDRYGILVWQEFMLACNYYPTKGRYLTVLEEEARSIITQLRSHPCITLWCGGNELFNSWSGMDDQSPALRLLNKLCYELQPEIPFLPTSPLYGMAHGGYYFADAKGEEIFQSINNANFIAYTEFGVPSLASVEGLQSIIPPEELFPVDAASEAWIAHHGFEAGDPTAWVYPERLAKYFGEPSSLRELVENSQWTQAIGYQGAFEEMRRQAPHCSMMLNWCFNEPWITAAGNSLLEYPAKPKPSYHAVKAALRPQLFSARIKKFVWFSGETLELDLWLLNDAPRAAEGKVTVTVELGGETYEILEWQATAEAGCNKEGPTARLKLPLVEDVDRFTVKLSAGELSGSYCLKYRLKRPMPPSRLMNH